MPAIANQFQRFLVYCPNLNFGRAKIGESAKHIELITDLPSCTLFCVSYFDRRFFVKYAGLHTNNSAVMTNWNSLNEFMLESHENNSQ